jgi:hypothetical protein
MLTVLLLVRQPEPLQEVLVQLGDDDGDRLHAR